MNIIGKIRALFLMCGWIWFILLLKAIMDWYPMKELWVDYWDGVKDNWITQS